MIYRRRLRGRFRTVRFRAPRAEWLSLRFAELDRCLPAYFRRSTFNPDAERRLRKGLVGDASHWTRIWISQGIQGQIDLRIKSSRVDQHRFNAALEGIGLLSGSVLFLVGPVFIEPLNRLNQVPRNQTSFGLSCRIRTTKTC